MPFNGIRFLFQALGYPIAKAERALKDLQSLNAEQFHDWQTKARWEIAKYHYDNNEWYQNKIGKVLPNRWEDLPIVTKKDLQQPLATIISKRVKLSDCYTSSTSGSSGIPFFFAKDKFAHAMTWAVILNRYSWYNIAPSSLQARFYGIPKQTKYYAQEKFKDLLMNRVRFDVFDLSDERLASFLTSFRKKQFTYIYGYTSALVVFAKYLLKQQVVLKDICPSLKIGISTSEMATMEDDTLMRKAFGIPHIREYGISETCLTAFDHPNGSWLLTEETLFNEVVNESNSILSNGEEGKLISTSLFNKALPMVRYETGDVAMLAGSAREKHRTLEKLVGRTNDIIQLPNNKTAAGLSFYYISRSVLEQSNCLKEFIIRQVALDHFVFDVVTDRTLNQEEINTIEANLKLYLGEGLRLTINRVEQITRTEAGKRQHFYSELGKA